MTSPLHQAINLNNDAVNLFGRNQKERALENLRMAIEIMKEVVKRGQRTDKHFDLPYTAVSHCDYIHIKSIDATNRPSDEDLFIHKDMFRLKYPSQSFGVETIAMYSAIILLNGALFHHRKSPEGNMAKCLFKAEKMYRASLQLVQGSFLAGNTTALIVAVVASNNLAQIELQRGVIQNVTRRFRLLKQMLQGRCYDIVHVLPDYEIKELLSNSLLADGLVGACAA